MAHFPLSIWAHFEAACPPPQTNHLRLRNTVCKYAFQGVLQETKSMGIYVNGIPSSDRWADRMSQPVPGTVLIDIHRTLNQWLGYPTGNCKVCIQQCSTWVHRPLPVLCWVWLLPQDGPWCAGRSRLSHSWGNLLEQDRSMRTSTSISDFGCQMNEVVLQPVQNPGTLKLETRCFSKKGSQGQAVISQTVS